MAAGEKPSYRVCAVLEPRKGAQNTKERWVELGAAWNTSTGGVSFTLEAVPPEWNDPHVPRKVVLVPTERR